MVKDDKGILKGMCGNKTLKAVYGSTSSAYGLKVYLTRNFLLAHLEELSK